MRVILLFISSQLYQIPTVSALFLHYWAFLVSAVVLLMAEHAFELTVCDWK